MGKHFLLCCFIAGSALSKTGFAQGLFVNELSNGPSGSKEFLELVVTGPPCSTVDITGYMIDDNNGQDNGGCQGFSTNTGTGMGIAQGHYRFSNIPRWQAVPSGSIIVIYHGSDRNPAIPPDDPDDTAPQDSVYILPTDDSGLDQCPDNPDSSPASCSYTCGSYNNPPTSTTAASFRNSGDAGQVRLPSGAYEHGICYGSDMTGGPDNLLISASSGSGDVFYFTDNNFRDVSNWSVGSAGTADETPGTYNNAANQAFIDSIRGTCPLPIELLVFYCEAQENQVKVKWTTQTETNNDYFLIQRSQNGQEYKTIGREEGAGQSMLPRHYVFFDKEPIQGKSYYRLKQVDFDNTFSFSPVFPINYGAKNNGAVLHITPNPVREDLHYTFISSITASYQVAIINGTGQQLFSQKQNFTTGINESTLSTTHLSTGLYLLVIKGKHRTFTRKFIVR